ncbi:MAG: hypothetical protein JWR68_334 [Polaromonas sp.]|nr:hypothetical protein [Polaromonas sp.]
MPLPPSVPRDALHLRRIELRGYQRADGLFDIEAHMVDTKTEAITVGGGRVVAPGEPIHDMSIRLVLDADLLVTDVIACTDASPHGICPDATGTLQCLKGVRIGPGWSKAIRERLGGRKGCTHLTELLKPLATVAFQTLWKVRENQPAAVDSAGKPRKIDSCYAYASDREIVQVRWSMHFDGSPPR